MTTLGAFQDVDAGPSGFADPDWRGNRSLYDGFDEGCRLRSYRSIMDQQRCVAALIRAGESGGRLDAYQARRASFDLESIRAQVAREFGRSHVDDEDRRAIQSRLDRLEACVCAALAPDRQTG